MQNSKFHNNNNNNINNKLFTLICFTHSKLNDRIPFSFPFSLRFTWKNDDKKIHLMVTEKIIWLCHLNFINLHADLLIGTCFRGTRNSKIRKEEEKNYYENVEQAQPSVMKIEEEEEADDGKIGKIADLLRFPRRNYYYPVYCANAYKTLFMFSCFQFSAVKNKWNLLQILLTYSTNFQLNVKS